MKRLLTVFLLVITVVFCYAQDLDEIVVDGFKSDSTVYHNKLVKKDKKLITGVDVNMGYSFSKYGGGPIFSLTPHVTYPVTDRFYLQAGISAGIGNVYNPFMYSSEEQPAMMPMTRMFLYASGNYKASEKLVITGSAYKYIMDVKNPNSSYNPTQSSYNFQGVSIGFNYKITDNLSFGAQFHFDTPNTQNSLYSPLGNSYYAPTYGW